MSQERSQVPRGPRIGPTLVPRTRSLDLVRPGHQVGAVFRRVLGAARPHDRDHDRITTEEDHAVEDIPTILCGLIVGSVTAVLLAAAVHFPGSASFVPSGEMPDADAFISAQPHDAQPHDAGPVYPEPR